MLARLSCRLTGCLGRTSPETGRVLPPTCGTREPPRASAAAAAYGPSRCALNFLRISTHAIVLPDMSTASLRSSSSNPLAL